MATRQEGASVVTTFGEWNVPLLAHQDFLFSDGQQQKGAQNAATLEQPDLCRRS